MIINWNGESRVLSLFIILILSVQYFGSVHRGGENCDDSVDGPSTVLTQWYANAAEEAVTYLDTLPWSGFLDSGIWIAVRATGRYF